MKKKEIHLIFKFYSFIITKSKKFLKKKPISITLTNLIDKTVIYELKFF